MRFGLSSAWLGAAAAATFVASPALAGHVQREIVDIAVGAGAQFDPSIKGDDIAYTQQLSGGDADVVVYSISAGAVLFTIDADGAQDVEDIDGNYVVYRQWSGTDDKEIWVYDRASGTYTQITNDDLDQTNPAISGNRIVWQQGSDANATIHTATVDLSDGPRAIGSGRNPAISGDTVVWQTSGNEIVAYDVTNGFSRTIGSGGSPDIHGTKVVFANGGDIYIKDLASSAPAQPLTNDGFTTTQSNPKVSDTLVAWENRYTVTNADGTTYTEIDVDAWDFRVNQVETLAGGPGVQQLHDVDGTNLAFTDRSVDASGDIRLVREVPQEEEPEEPGEPAELPDDPCAADADVLVLFEETFTRSAGEPAEEVRSFDSHGRHEARVCVVSNGVSAAYLDMNDVRLLSPSDFHNEDEAAYEIAMYLGEESNSLAAEVRGSPGDSLTVRVVAAPDAGAAHASAAGASSALGGCSVAPAQNSPWGILALIGLALLRRRRV